MTGNEDEIERVLGFWFGREPGTRLEKWFKRDDAFDAELRAAFGSLHDCAVAGGCDHWAGSARGALALVIVLDQFSRNLYRGDARAFAGDPKALALAREALEKGWDQEVGEIERLFFYLPFEHSEDIEDQKRSISLLAAFGDRSVAVAERHLSLILRFGRFPHRNAALGRTNTLEEETYLNGPRDGFEAG